MSLVSSNTNRKKADDNITDEEKLVQLRQDQRGAERTSRPPSKGMKSRSVEGMGETSVR